LIIILTPYIGNGVWDKLLWDVEELYDDLKRLERHIGKPEGDDFNCPIFTQDKVMI